MPCECPQLQLYAVVSGFPGADRRINKALLDAVDFSHRQFLGLHFLPENIPCDSRWGCQRSAFRMRTQSTVMQLRHDEHIKWVAGLHQTSVSFDLRITPQSDLRRCQTSFRGHGGCLNADQPHTVLCSQGIMPHKKVRHHPVPAGCKLHGRRHGDPVFADFLSDPNRHGCCIHAVFPPRTAVFPADRFPSSIGTVDFFLSYHGLPLHNSQGTLKNMERAPCLHVSVLPALSNLCYNILTEHPTRREGRTQMMEADYESASDPLVRNRRFFYLSQ